MAILSIILYVVVDPNLGVDILKLFGDGILNTVLSLLTTFVGLILLFWVSGYYFAIGWDAFSDTAKWFRRRKIGSLVSPDLIKLKEILN